MGSTYYLFFIRSWKIIKDELFAPYLLFARPAWVGKTHRTNGIKIYTMTQPSNFRLNEQSVKLPRQACYLINMRTTDHTLGSYFEESSCN
jgi:hypothetical protein